MGTAMACCWQAIAMSMAMATAVAMAMSMAVAMSIVDQSWPAEKMHMSIAQA